MAYEQSGPSYAKLFGNLTSSQLRQREYERRASLYRQRNPIIDFEKQSVSEFMNNNTVHDAEFNIIQQYRIGPSWIYVEPSHYLVTFTLKSCTGKNEHNEPTFVTYSKTINSRLPPKIYINEFIGLTFQEASAKIDIIDQHFKDLVKEEPEFFNYTRKLQSLQSLQG